MRKYRVTYLPFATSDLESSDVIVYAVDEGDARREFERIRPGFVFKSAQETMEWPRKPVKEIPQ